jgi:molybdopterin/thiamine biosynthesis adenylyltransferase
MTQSLGALHDALQARGFSFVSRASNGWLRYRGNLSANSAVHACELDIEPRLLNLPRIRMVALPQDLPRVVPHLGEHGQLCYLAKGAVALDIFDVPGQVLACICQAEKVLTALLKGEHLEDLEEEFYAYWHGWTCVVDLQTQRMGRQDCLVISESSGPMLVVTDDRKRTGKKLELFGKALGNSAWPAFRVQTKASPRPDRIRWPPKNFGQLLAWQGRLDLRCKKKLEQRVREAISEKASGVLLLIDSPRYTYGVAVAIDRKSSSRRRQRLTNAQLHSFEITPVGVVRLDDKYVAERNTPGRATLSAKRIVLVGCGTIGGYLADLLVKAGAGTDGGWLELVDFDSLLPSNIGRHRLGFEHVFVNKAIALRQELCRQAPGADIRALPVDVSEAGLGEYDLLIDATGEESLGFWLAQSLNKNAAMASVWIEGPGLAARALLRSQPNAACYRCLSDLNREGQLRVFAKPTPTLLAGQGCEGLYVPFPATASVQAASLAAEMAVDWANGQLSPALRTRLLVSNMELATSDRDVPRQLDCPACSA